MPSLDAKKFMQLIQYYNLLNKRLKSIIEEKELEEYFFGLLNIIVKSIGSIML